LFSCFLIFQGPVQYKANFLDFPDVVGREGNRLAPMKPSQNTSIGEGVPPTLYTLFIGMQGGGS
jgi:hypothetical protein